MSLELKILSGKGEDKLSDSSLKKFTLVSSKSSLLFLSRNFSKIVFENPIFQNPSF